MNLKPTPRFAVTAKNTQQKQEAAKTHFDERSERLNRTVTKTIQGKFAADDPLSTYYEQKQLQAQAELRRLRKLSSGDFPETAQKTSAVGPDKDAEADPHM